MVEVTSLNLSEMLFSIKKTLQNSVSWVSVYVDETSVSHCETQAEALLKIEVKLIASLGKERFKREVREYPPGTAARQVAEDLSIPVEHIGIILVNEQHAALDDALNDGDTIFLLPLVGGG